MMMLIAYALSRTARERPVVVMLGRNRGPSHLGRSALLGTCSAAWRDCLPLQHLIKPPQVHNTHGCVHRNCTQRCCATLHNYLPSHTIWI